MNGQVPLLTLIEIVFLVSIPGFFGGVVSAIHENFDNADNETVESFTISGVPTGATLMLDGSAVAANSTFTAADLGNVSLFRVIRRNIVACGCMLHFFLIFSKHFARRLEATPYS